MRLAVVALLAASFSGAAWAGVRHAGQADCRADYSISVETLADSLEATLEQALDALADADLQDAVLAEVEAEIDGALAELELELAALEHETDIQHEAQEAEMEARLEVALERVERVLAHADYEPFEAANARNPIPDAPKRWRPRY